MNSFEITGSQDEQCMEDLFRDTDQVMIPIFQRNYSWTSKQLKELLDDIDLIRIGIEKSQFLGAIVSSNTPMPRQGGIRLRQSAIVDGQQRILTLYIFLMALVESIAKIDKEDAEEIVRANLLYPQRRGLEVNTRVFPTFKDRGQFVALWDRLRNALGDYLVNDPPHPPAPSGDDTGRLTKQYTRIIKYLKEKHSYVHEDVRKKEILVEIFDIISTKLTFVHLQLLDPSSAPKIFERLNSRGLSVSIIDLVRNEILSSLSDDTIEAQRVFDHVWTPFEKRFQNREDKFFFPYCLIHGPNTQKTEIFSVLRQLWWDLSPEDMIRNMAPYQSIFISIDITGNFEKSDDISKRLKRLIASGYPTSTYPFLMSMLEAFEQNISEDECIDLLDTIESFLIRRAITGLEPTGLHALFKGLWTELPVYTSIAFKKIVREKPTIQWPDDDEVREAIRKRALATSRVCNFLLKRYDCSLLGDNPESQATIEHILPQSFADVPHWSRTLERAEGEALVDTLANLIPLSIELNSSLKNAPYQDKKRRYEEESMFKSPRHVSSTWQEWNPDSLRERGAKLADWAVSEWPHNDR